MEKFFSQSLSRHKLFSVVEVSVVANAYCNGPNRIVVVQGSDTTGDDGSTIAG